MKRPISVILLIMVFLPLAGCLTKYLDDSEPFYTTHNIWFEKPERIYAINYKRGVIIPAGTKVRNIVYKHDDEYPFVNFSPEGFGGAFSLYMVPRWQPGLSIEELVKRTFSHKNFAELTQDLSDEEISLIKQGRVKVGMSRKAVEISYGFPALHQTPYYDKNTRWKYWLSRAKTQLIIFAGDWTVLQIID